MHRLSSKSVSLDSSVVVDFHHCGSLDILERAFAGRLLMSDLVREELNRAAILLPSAEIVALTTDEDWKRFEQLLEGRPGLGSGECGAIVVAWARGAAVLTNDKLARNCAEDFGIPVAGAIGVMEYAVEAVLISANDAVRILEEMIRAGAWISDELVESFRQRMAELS